MDAWLGGAQDQLQGPDRLGQNPALAHDLPAALLGHVGRRLHARHQTTPTIRRYWRWATTPTGRTSYGAAPRAVQQPYRKAHQQEGAAQIVGHHRRAADDLLQGPSTNLIATARSNKVAVLLGFQDFSQLKRDYGDKEAAVVMNTVGNIFSGQVVGRNGQDALGAVSARCCKSDRA